MKNWDRGLVSIDCHNPTIGTSIEQVNELSQLLVLDATACMEVAARLGLSTSSASDAAAGTGAQSVELVGIDTNFDVVSEVLVPTGVVTTQALTTKDYLRVFELACKACGTGRVNAGDLYIARRKVTTDDAVTVTAGVPSNSATAGLLKLPATYGNADAGVYVVPRGRSARALKLSVGAGTQGAVVQIVTRDLSTAGSPLVRRFTQVVGINTGLDIDLKALGLTFPEKTQIEVKAIGLAASSNLWARLDLSVM